MNNLILVPLRSVLIFVLLLVFGCTPDQPQVAERLDYKLSQLTFKSTDCLPETEACLSIFIEYPIFDKGDSLAMLLSNRISSNAILDFLGLGDVESTRAPDLAEATKALNSEFEKLKKDFKDYSTSWEATISTIELYRSDSILVLASSSMSYFGGAHANQNLRYFNFNRNTGAMISPLRLVDDKLGFTARAEQVFRKKYHLQKSESFESAGFSFLGDQFTLSANMAFLGDSVKLHYNAYEISSFAAGDFEVTVSRN